MPDFATAIGEAIPLATAAVQAGAKMLFLPEYCGGLRSDGARLVPPAAPENAHPVVAALRDLAAGHGVAVMVGSVAVPGPEGKLLNRGLMIDPSGNITGRYDKIHLFDIRLSASQSYCESATVSPGRVAVTHRAGDAVIGHTICYDLRFPHLFRALAQSGANILTAPAAFTKTTGAAHWHVLNRARAIENGAFMVSACAVGAVPGGGECYGHSLIVGPWGDVIADGGDLPGVVQARIDLDDADAARARIPSLDHDRAYRAADGTQRDVA